MGDEEFILNAERQAKQNYLKEEVVEAGFDTGEFIEYKEPDIDLWSFDELVSLVRGYKDHVREQQALEKKKSKAKPPPKKHEPVPVEEEKWDYDSK
jgi:hypothetical protein